MELVLTDTSAFYALADLADRHHREAVGCASRLTGSAHRVFTTNYIVAETHVLILSRLGPEAARKWLRDFSLPIEQVTAEDQAAARAIVLDNTDRSYSLTDAASFAVMRRLGVRRAFAFDTHFEQFGFLLERRP